MIKHNLVAALLILFGGYVSANTTTPINHFEESEYTVKKDYPHIKVSVNFGKSILLSEEQLQTLDMNTVYQIDLVYTKFKRSSSFDQNALNNQRLAQLKAVAPEIERDGPTWNFIAQTKAKDVKTAESYFHGFVIYYRPKGPDYSSLKEKFRPYRTNIDTIFMVDNAIGGSFDYPSGSRVHVPAEAAIDRDGKRVNGIYEIHYTEYRTPADIAFSGIPMTYRDTTENSNFSSIGMYEITGEQENKKVQLQKSVLVDFNTTAVVDDAAFYELDEQSGEWAMIRPIDPNEFGHELDGQAVGGLVRGNFEREEWKVTSWNMSQKRGMGVKVHQSGDFEEDYALELNQKAWKKFRKADKNEKTAALYKRVDEKNGKIYCDKETILRLTRSIYKGRYVKKNRNFRLGNGEMRVFDREVFVFEDNGDRTGSTMLASGMDKGHTYPKMVQGLNTKEFGVYNCDQIYRLPNRKTIHPEFVDAETGKKIANPDVACLMDLNYNGSFSFDPRHVTYNPDGKNALLLTAGSDQFYLILPETFEKIDKANPEPVLCMTNVTAQLKNTEDLKKILGL